MPATIRHNRLETEELGGIVVHKHVQLGGDDLEEHVFGVVLVGGGEHEETTGGLGPEPERDRVFLLWTRGEGQDYWI